MCQTVFLVANVFCTLPFMYAIQKKGIRINLIIGSFLITVFTWFRSLVVKSEDLWTVFYWSIPMAIGACFYFNLTTKICFDWFPVRQRYIALGIACIPYGIGPLVAFWIPDNYVSTAIKVKLSEQEENFHQYLIF